MSHKRKLSEGESPPAKRPNQAALEPTDPPKAAEQFVYLAVEEEYGEHMDKEQIVFEIYATVEDANNRLLARQRENTAIDLEEWETTYDKYGCLHSVAEGLEDVHNTELAVRRMEVRPPGSAPAVPTGLSESGGENSYDEDEEEEEEEEEEPYAQRSVRTWSRNRPARDCGGCGCGSCQNCLSMMRGFGY